MKRDKQAERTAVEVPSALSIWALAVLAGMMLATSFWIVLGPIEEYNLRTALGGALGSVAAFQTALQAGSRFSRRLSVIAPTGRHRAAPIEHDDEADSDGPTGWITTSRGGL